MSTPNSSSNYPLALPPSSPPPTMPLGSAGGRPRGATQARRRAARGVVEEERAPGAQASDSTGMDLELEQLFGEHREGMVVRTGLRCHHGLYPILCCNWSGSTVGRRFLSCSQVEQPCEFKYWIDQEFSGRARRVIEDLVSMRQSMTELFVNSSEQWDAMYAQRQGARKEIRELKSTISEQRSCIMLLLCFCIVIGGGLWLIL